MEKENGLEWGFRINNWP